MRVSMDPKNIRPDDDLERILLDTNEKPTKLRMPRLEAITDHFSDSRRIGGGGFADVYEGKLSNGKVAVKKLKQHVLDDTKFHREVASLMKVKHKNIVRFLGYCSDTQGDWSKCDDGKDVMAEERERFLCFEFLENGSLDNYINDASKGLEWRARYQIIKGICEALHYLHGINIVHSDLKPANILLDHNMVAKICDFGLSRIFEEGQTRAITEILIGSLGYMAPEYFREHVITYKSDIYSLGIIIIEILTGQKANRPIQQVLDSWRTRLDTSQGVKWLDHVEVCAKIGLDCVDNDPEKRPTTGHIIERLRKLEHTIEADHLITQRLDTLGFSSLSVELSLGKVPSSSSSGTFLRTQSDMISRVREPLDVVIVYAFDCTLSTIDWYVVDVTVFWMVQEKLTHFVNSTLGYIYPMLARNNYTSDMKLVDSAEGKHTGYTAFARRRISCTKNMASGLIQAHKMINNRGYHNGIILFFSDGLIYKEDFFRGAENFISQVPVHTFTLHGDAYNQGLRTIAANSPGGKFHTAPVPDRPDLSEHFSTLLDNILGGSTLSDEKKPPSSRISSAMAPLDVVIVYAFDCSDWNEAWYTVDDVIFWMVHGKLSQLPGSCMGYIYPRLIDNTYTSDMKLVDPSETRETGYKAFARRRVSCKKNMASGLIEAHQMIRNQNGIIVFFSDGLINNGDFFDGTDDFVSQVPVHTFTLGSGANTQGLLSIAVNSPGGTFDPVPVPERPQLSLRFSQLLDRILSRATATD